MPVDKLADALALTEIGPGRYSAENDIRGERGVVFGGQLIAQLIVAGATADPDKTVKDLLGDAAVTGFVRFKLGESGEA